MRRPWWRWGSPLLSLLVQSSSLDDGGGSNPRQRGRRGEKLIKKGLKDFVVKPGSDATKADSGLKCREGEAISSAQNATRRTVSALAPYGGNKGEIRGK